MKYRAVNKYEMRIIYTSLIFFWLLIASAVPTLVRFIKCVQDDGDCKNCIAYAWGCEL